MTSSHLMVKIKVFNQELDAIIGDISKISTKTITDSSLKERLNELYFTWSQNIKVIFSATKSNTDLLSQVEPIFEYVFSNITKKINKSKFRLKLKDIRKIIGLLTINTLKFGGAPGTAIQHLGFIQSIPDLPSELFPPHLVGHVGKIEKFLKKYPFDTNVFIMTRYEKASSKLYLAIKKTINEYHENDKTFNAIIANEHSLTDDMYNWQACLISSKYGIAIFDSLPRKPIFNPNVTYELGMMHFLQRKCLLLKNKNIQKMPSDFFHKIYENYNSNEESLKIVKSWLNKITSD